MALGKNISFHVNIIEIQHKCGETHGETQTRKDVVRTNKKPRSITLHIRIAFLFVGIDFICAKFITVGFLFRSFIAHVAITLRSWLFFMPNVAVLFCVCVSLLALLLVVFCSADRLVSEPMRSYTSIHHICLHRLIIQCILFVLQLFGMPVLTNGLCL